MDMEILHGYGGINKEIDDITKSYTVSEDGNISAGDLCEFINGQVRKTFQSYATSVNTQVNNVASAWISSTILDKNHVLVCYNYNATSLYGVVLTINGCTISVGTLTQINAVSSLYVQCTALDSSRVLIVYSDDANSKYLKSVIITISGTTISVGSITQINSATSMYTRIISIDINRVYVQYANASLSYNTYGLILTISGSTITVGSITFIDGMQNVASDIVLLDTDRILTVIASTTAHGANVIRIDGTKVSVPSVRVNLSNPVVPNLVRINSNLVIMGYMSSYLYIYPITINGYTITEGTQISSGVAGTDSLCMKLIDNNRILCSYRGASNYLYSSIFTYDEVSGTMSTGTPLAVLSSAVTGSYITCKVLDSMRSVISCILTTGYVWSVVVGTNDINVSLKVVINTLSPCMIAKNSVNVGEIGSFVFKGIIKDLSGLSPNKNYYCDENGNLTTNITNYKIGVALSDTTLLINQLLNER